MLPFNAAEEVAPDPPNESTAQTFRTVGRAEIAHFARHLQQARSFNLG